MQLLYIQFYWAALGLLVIEGALSLQINLPRLSVHFSS